MWSLLLICDLVKSLGALRVMLCRSSRLSFDPMFGCSCFFCELHQEVNIMAISAKTKKQNKTLIFKWAFAFRFEVSALTWSLSWVQTWHLDATVVHQAERFLLCPQPKAINGIRDADVWNLEGDFFLFFFPKHWPVKCDPLRARWAEWNPRPEPT